MGRSLSLDFRLIICKMDFEALQRDYLSETRLTTATRKNCWEHPLLNDNERRQGNIDNVEMNDSDDEDNEERKKDMQTPAPEREGMTLIDPLSDPLGNMLGGGDFDPLGAMGAPPAPSTATIQSLPPVSNSPTKTTPSSNKKNATNNNESTTGIQFRWNEFKNDVLLNYNVSGKFRVKANFMTDVEDGLQQNQKQLPTDHAKKRLEKLEESKEEAAASIEVTQKEFVRRIESLHRELISSWERNERVQTLKIAIQCAKLMQDTTVVSFYPSAFMMLTSVLDSFGGLVYKRILVQAQDLAKAEGSVPIVDNEFTCRDVPQAAKEICRNWFYKTACIRELVPRFYVEMALMKCYIFLGEGVYPRVVTRTVGIIRGVGDTLVAGWSRVYLSKIAAELITDPDVLQKHLLNLHNDYMFTWSQVTPIQDEAAPEGDSKNESGGDNQKLPPVHGKFLKSRGINHNEYTRLHRPAFGWLANELGTKATKDIFKTTIKNYRDYCGDGVSLKAILDGFEPLLWAKSASGVMQLIKEANVNDVTLTDLVGALGRGLILQPPPEKQRVTVLNECWKIVTKDTDLVRYAKCASIWIQLALTHYQEKHVQTLLKDLVKHIRVAADPNASEKIVTDLESTLKKKKKIGADPPLVVNYRIIVISFFFHFQNSMANFFLFSFDFFFCF